LNMDRISESCCVQFWSLKSLFFSRLNHCNTNHFCGMKRELHLQPIQMIVLQTQQLIFTLTYLTLSCPQLQMPVPCYFTAECVVICIFKQQTKLRCFVLNTRELYL
jgi:hypothetical protein